MRLKKKVPINLRKIYKHKIYTYSRHKTKKNLYYELAVARDYDFNRVIVTFFLN